METEVEVGIEDKFWTAKQIEEAKKKRYTWSWTQQLEKVTLNWKVSEPLVWYSHNEVFSVCFDKKGKALTKKAYNAR